MRRLLLVSFGALLLLILVAADPARAQTASPPYCRTQEGFIHSSPRESKLTIRRYGLVLTTLTIPPGIIWGACYDRLGPGRELTGNVIIRVGSRGDIAPSGTFTADQMMVNAPLDVRIDDAEILVDPAIGLGDLQ